MLDDPEYLSKLERFEALYADRIATATSLLADDHATVSAVETSLNIVTAALEELRGLYRDVYLDRDPAVGKDAVLRFTRLEANIAMSVQQTLDAMRKLIRLRTASRPIRAARSRVLRRAITTINASLARRDDAAPLSATVAFSELMLARRKPVKTALRVIGLIGLHRPISDWPRWLDPGNFFRADDITFSGFDAALAAMAAHPRRVMVVVGNHDSSLYDGSLADRVSRALGSRHHIVMARKKVYPIPPPESAGDVVYVDEDDPNSYPVAESLDRVKKFSGQCDVVSMAVYPEGMMPFTGAQMPLVAKDGAYIVARKIAIAFADQDVPVFMVEFQTNTVTHLTTTDCVEPEVRIVSVEIVPNTPMVKGRPDPWIVSRRLQSQTLYNEHRGERMLDIVAGRRIPGSHTFEASADLRVDVAR